MGIYKITFPLWITSKVYYAEGEDIRDACVKIDIDYGKLFIFGSWKEVNEIPDEIKDVEITDNENHKLITGIQDIINQTGRSSFEINEIIDCMFKDSIFRLQFVEKTPLVYRFLRIE